MYSSEGLTRLGRRREALERLTRWNRTTGRIHAKSQMTLFGGLARKLQSAAAGNGAAPVGVGKGARFEAWLLQFLVRGLFG